MDAGDSKRLRSIAVRDAAVRRLRRLTIAAGAIAALAMGFLAALTAASTHTRTVVRHALAASAVTTSQAVSVPEPAATVSVASDVSAANGAATTTTSTPVSAPAPASSAPVVVSGGS